jgi:tetratricopeptide (TPR) repeat protein
MATGNGSTLASNGGPSKPLVFVSYAHEDEEWKNRFEKHLGVLEHQGYLTQWHDRQIGAGANWLREIEGAMTRASVAVLLISENSLTSDFILRQEVKRLLERRDKEGLRIYPIVIKPCDWEAVDWLRKMQLRPKDGRAISGGKDHEIGADFAEITKEIRLHLATETKSRIDRPQGLTQRPRVSTTRLPKTGEYLFGREIELEQLNGAWLDPTTNVLSLIAWGGVGKSTLVKHWLGRMAQEGYRGAQRVYGWSFYRQGTETQASADQFVNAALEWFGDPDPLAGSVWAKGERLAKLVQAERTLLILDGLEPLQNPPGPDQGRLKDPALERLLGELDADNPGLCLITSRIPVAELLDHRYTTAPVIELDRLSDPAGAELLRVLGVEGEQEELGRVSRAFGGHSLTLTLLGTYLRDVLDGDIRRLDQVGLLVQDKEQGGPARRLMASYEAWLGEGAEQAILHCLGLFDRPIERGLLDVLRAPPVIAGLTETLVGLPEPRLRQALGRLQRTRLITEDKQSGPYMLDSHPLVREHFGAELREKHPDAWRAGHARLYEHFKDLPEKHQPDTLEEMAPLFQAVFHGCQAGRHQEALDEVYWARIARMREGYVVKKLGAFGADLAALAGFFDQPWERPVGSITEADQGFVSNSAGFALRALGRLPDAVAPMRTSLDRYVGQGHWKQAGGAAGNLSELQLTQGEVAEAIALAERSVEYADRSGDSFERMGARIGLADARHQAGERARAQALFQESERLQVERQPRHQRLYSVQGYRYCDLLLDLGRHAEVRDRANYSIEIARRNNWLLDIALDHLSLGRAEVVAHEAAGSGDLAEAETHLHQAIDGLRRAGTIHNLPRGLVARAAYFWLTRQYDRVRRDLDEALRIAIRSHTRLHECDAHLEYARLELAQSNREAARPHLTRAEKLVAATGYHRRDKDLEKLKGALA